MQYHVYDIIMIYIYIYIYDNNDIAYDVWVIGKICDIILFVRISSTPNSIWFCIWYHMSHNIIQYVTKYHTSTSYVISFYSKTWNPHELDFPLYLAYTRYKTRYVLRLRYTWYIPVVWNIKVYQVCLPGIFQSEDFQPNLYIPGL